MVLQAAGAGRVNGHIGARFGQVEAGTHLFGCFVIAFAFQALNQSVQTPQVIGMLPEVLTSVSESPRSSR